ncbi:hypothetical protein [Blastomonas sp.]|uniref:hypothetical protein n=1 Tax=Blastomonas sp. TaxID=1909299 RepID=UPI0035935266
MIRLLAKACTALTGAALAFGASVPAHAQGATPALPNNSTEAAIMCFYAATLAGGGQTEVIAEASWFLFDAARRETADNPDAFIGKIDTLAGTPPPNLETVASDAPALLPLCASRYPLISSKRTITLPADSFARDVQCMALTGYMIGLAEGELEDSGDNPFTTRMKALEVKLETKLTPERYLAAGLGTEESAYERLFSRALRDVSPLGNLMSVLTACEVAGG